MKMRSFTDNGAQSIFLDPTSTTFFAHFSKMNSTLDGTNDKTLEQAKNGLFLGNNESERVESNPSVTLPPNETEKQDVGNVDEKKMKRVLANRRSARESYQRRKKMFSELEGAVTTLTKENAGLADENKKLRRQVMSLHQQLDLQLMPGCSSVGNSIGSGMGSKSLALQQLAAQQQHQQTGQRSGGAQPLSRSSGAHQGSQQQQQLAQQQGELDQLLELILKGRSS
jgi:hypothetical protein